MTTFTKNYIGKGTQVENMDIVKIFIPEENIAACTFEIDGKNFVGFEVAKMLNPDKFGRTHTVYFTVKEKAPAKKATRKTRKKKQEPVADDLPF